MCAYLLPEGLELDDALASHLSIQAEPTHVSQWTFYDTFDGRLHAAGLTLRHGDGQLAIVELATGSERAHAPLDRAPEKLFEADLPEPLRAPLAPLIEMRALTTLACVKSRFRRLAVLNEDEKTVVRLNEETADGLRTRVNAVAVRGYDKDLARVREILGDSLGLTETEEPLADAAIAAAGTAPGGVSSKLDLALTRGEPAGTAAEKVLARTHAIVLANLPGTLADVDSEFLHDLRVANRRARSLLRQLKDVFAPEPLERLREELKWIQQVTGDTRDLDVQLLDFEDYSDREALKPLHDVLVLRRAKAFATMKRALQTKRAERVLEHWADLRALPDSDPIEAVAGDRIGKVYRRMVRMGEAIADDSPHEALHDLRKVGKELRYLLEFFGDLFAAEEVKPMIKALKALQDVLGRFQDFEVQADTLRALTTDVAAQPGGNEGLLAMGVLIDRLSRAQHQARTRVRRPVRRVLGGAAARRRSRRRSDEHRPRHLQRQGRRREDLGGRQPRRAGRSRRRADAAVGPRSAGRLDLPVPRQAEGQGRREQARARQDRRRRADQGHRPRGPGPAARGLLLPTHGPGAGRDQEANGAARARARAARRRVRVRVPGLPAERVAGERERVRGGRRPARPDHPGDALLAHLRADRAAAVATTTGRR